MLYGRIVPVGSEKMPTAEPGWGHFVFLVETGRVDLNGQHVAYLFVTAVTNASK
jgi:hypothetical protein